MEEIGLFLTILDSCGKPGDLPWKFEKRYTVPLSDVIAEILWDSPANQKKKKRGFYQSRECGQTFIALHFDVEILYDRTTTLLLMVYTYLLQQIVIDSDDLHTSYIYIFTTLVG